MHQLSKQDLLRLEELRRSYHTEAALAVQLHAHVSALLGKPMEPRRDMPVASHPLLDVALRARTVPSPEQYSAMAHLPMKEITYKDNRGEEKQLQNLEDYQGFYKWLETKRGDLAWLDQTATWTLLPLHADASQLEYDVALTMPTCAAALRAETAGNGATIPWVFFELVLGGARDLPRSLMHWPSERNEPAYLKLWRKELKSEGKQNYAARAVDAPAIRMLRNIYLRRCNMYAATAASATANKVAFAHDLANVALASFRGIDGSPDEKYAFPPGLRSWAIDGRLIEKLTTFLEQQIQTMKASIWKSIPRSAAMQPDSIRSIVLMRSRRCLAWHSPSKNKDILADWGWPPELQVRIRVLTMRVTLAPLYNLFMQEHSSSKAWNRIGKIFQELHQKDAAAPIVALTWLFVINAVRDNNEVADPDRWTFWRGQDFSTEWKRWTVQGQQDDADMLNLLQEAEELLVSQMPFRHEEPNSFHAKAIAINANTDTTYHELSQTLGVVALPLLMAAFVIQHAFETEEATDLGLPQPEIALARDYAIRLLRRQRSPAAKQYTLTPQSKPRQLYHAASIIPKPTPATRPAVGGSTATPVEDFYVAQIIRRLAFAMPGEVNRSTTADAVALLVTRPLPSLQTPHSPHLVLAAMAACSIARICETLPCRGGHTIDACLRCQLPNASDATEAMLIAAITAQLPSEAAPQAVVSQLYAGALRSWVEWRRLPNQELRVEKAALRIADCFLPKTQAAPRFPKLTAVGRLAHNNEVRDFTVRNIKAELDYERLIEVELKSLENTEVQVLIVSERWLPHRGSSFNRKTRSLDSMHSQQLRNFLQRGQDHLILLRLRSDVVVGDLLDYAFTLKAELQPQIRNEDTTPRSPYYVGFRKSSAPQLRKVNSAITVPQRLKEMRQWMPSCAAAHLLFKNEDLRSQWQEDFLFQDSYAPSYQENHGVRQLTYLIPAASLDQLTEKWTKDGANPDSNIETAYRLVNDGEGARYCSAATSSLEYCVQNFGLESFALGTFWFLESLDMTYTAIRTTLGEDIVGSSNTPAYTTFYCGAKAESFAIACHVLLVASRNVPGTAAQKLKDEAGNLQDVAPANPESSEELNRAAEALLASAEAIEIFIYDKIQPSSSLVHVDAAMLYGSAGDLTASNRHQLHVAREQNNYYPLWPRQCKSE